MIRTYKDKKTGLYGYKIYIRTFLFADIVSTAVYTTRLDAYSAAEDTMRTQE